MSRNLQCLFMLKIFIFIGVLWIPQSTAQLSLSSPTDVQCYDRPVTLVCTHPVLPQEPEYLSGDVDWRRDGRGISVSGLGLAEPNSTTATLQFTITENSTGNYTCFLSNNVRGGIVESNSVSVIPRDQLPTPVNIATFSNSTTAVLTVSFDPQCCNTVQLTVDITTNSSSATTPVVHSVDSTDPTNTTVVITDITEGVCYTASIQSVCEDNNLLEDSGVLSVNFNGPPEVTATTGSTITLTWNTALRCFESEMFTFVVIWNEIVSGTSTNVTTSSSPYTISGLQPGTSYQISVLVVGESGVTSRTTVHNVATLAKTPTGGGYLATVVAIATVAVPVVAVTLLLVAILIAIVPVVAHCWKTRTHTGFRTRREDLPTSEQETNPPPDNDSEKKDLMAIVHETSPPLTNDQRVKHIFPRLINDLSESEDLPTSEQVMNILSNGGSCTPSFELFAEASRDGESSIGQRENGGGAASFQKPLPRREGSKDGAQDAEENALTELRKFIISKICEKVDKASRSKWTIRGAWLLVIIGILTFCGPGSPESHLTTNTPDSHRSMKTYQTMWKLVITCNWGGNEMEEVPKSSYVIFFTEQDIQDEANLERLLNQILWMILQKDTMPHCHSTRHLQSAGTKTTNHYASLPNIFVQN